MSNGRAGWNIVTTAGIEAARNFNLEELPPHAERYAMAEDAVAEGLARLLATARPIATPEGTTSVTGGLDPAQREAVQQIAEHGVVVLHGGPGTGKSRTVAAVVQLAKARHLRIALAAPTGRAAKRLEELTDTTASTLHRLLGAQAPGGRASCQASRSRPVAAA